MATARKLLPFPTMPTRSGFADLNAEHRFFALAVLPSRVRDAQSAGFWRGLMLGLAFGVLGGALALAMVLR